MRNRVLVLILAVLVLMTGCASDKRKTTMDDTLRLYERSIKWGNYADAQILTQKPFTQETLDRYRDIKVISYEVVRQEVIGDFDQLNQVVEIKFFHEQQGTIKTVRDSQVWIYDDERDAWKLDSGLPDFMSAFE
jgi:hypothetical protein